MSERIEVNKIFQGDVSAVHNYGAFIRIPGFGRTQGLVHKSQISTARVDDATEVLELNDKVWCKVITVTDDNKIGLSMKVVDQGSGRDLDPNGVQTSLDAQQRKERGGGRESSAITLGAVLNTKCSKCGVAGHLSKNCFKTPDGKMYDLIPEPEPEKKIFGSTEDRLRRLAEAGISEANASTSVEKKKKKRRSSHDSKLDRDSKKRKRHKRRQRDSTSDDEVRNLKHKHSLGERHQSGSDSSSSCNTSRKKVKHRKEKKRTY